MTSTALGRISSLAQLQMKLEDNLKAAEKRVDEIKVQLRSVAEVDLPEAMESVEMEEFKLEDGTKIKVSPTYIGNISAANADKAYAWLRKKGFDGLIKHDVAMSFGKGEEAIAKQAISYMEKRGWHHKDKTSVHAQTLRAFVREQLEEGNEFPMELFGAQRLVKAKIIRPKV